MSETQKPGADEPSTLVGRDLVWQGRDLGRLDELINARGQSYLLLDSRHWTFGERRLLPALLVSAVDGPAGTASLDVEPMIVRRAPDFDAFKVGRADHLAMIDAHYGAAATPPRRT